MSLIRLRIELKRAERFLTPARSDDWLAILRIGLGFQVILYCFSIGRDWPTLFAGSGSGIVGRQFSEALVGMESSFIPTFGRLVRAANALGMTEHTTLILCWLLLLGSGCGLLAGRWCRPSAIIAWFVHLCAAKSGGWLSYGVDNFTTIGLFYLMLSPLPDSYSVDFRRREKSATRPRDARFFGFFQRVLQLHLCLIYFFSGLSKCLGIGWWNGINLWRALVRPPFTIVPPELLVHFKYLLPPLGIAICVLEIAYPIMIWRKRTRFPWLLAICAMHVAIGVTMGMYLFALVMIVLNVAAFGREPNLSQ